jgi:hypothetical protein
MLSRIPGIFEADPINPDTFHHQTQGAIILSMHQSNPSNPSSTRPTLKLKIAVQKSPREIKTAPPPRPQSKLSQKAGAAWSDEYRQRMQEDMDALALR